MGPRPDGRGEENIARIYEKEADELQWGRDLTVAERGGRARPAPVHAGFNGAAT